MACHVALSNGLRMPSIGLGTYKIRKKEDIYNVIEAALVKNNYKLIDTAAVYGNEVHIGAALKDFNIDRNSIFITSKLAPKDHGTERAKCAIEASLSSLDTKYLDLYLIHWPGVQKLDPSDHNNSSLRIQSWKVLEEFYERGILRSIGVSNFNVSHLEELMSECKIIPHVNQIEVHPYYQQRELVKYCKDHNIHVTAYSSLGTTSIKSELLDDTDVRYVAQKFEKSAAQILLKWALQKGLSVIPKSTNPDHIRDNIQLDFDIQKDDLEALDSLEKGKKFAWNPNSVL